MSPTFAWFCGSCAYRAAGGFDANAGNVLRFRPGRSAKGLGFGEDALLGWRVRRAGRAAFASDAVVQHHVFAPDIRDTVRRAWMSGAFPALVREIPELRDTALAYRFFLGTSRIPLYVAVALSGARRQRLALPFFAWWVLHHARRVRGTASNKRVAAGLAGELLVDATLASALVAGSARARRVVL